ncbi:EamA family transporter [Symbioplanes lichenis]|uniref:EamA family transporter n=1 Tax=Symbioplanes lichenis TaxID=1629072 RepID=UPI002739AE92|nr:EamA family transporter [Actinoplanes lichenis]
MRGVSLALVSMLFAQLGLASSVGLIDDLGPAGAAWVRLCWAGLIVLALVRPRLTRFTRAGLLSTVLLGVVTAGITMTFMGAVARLPLGTASSLEFLGPLGVAVWRGGRTAKLWALVAGGGVVLLTSPWRGDIDPVGVAFALAAGLCWAAYILLTQRVGDQVPGLAGIAVSLPVAALVATVVAAPAAAPELTWPLILTALGVAVLLPVVPFLLEFVALRHLDTAAFGILMALEPVYALVIGVLVLGQRPGWSAAAGVACVVAAGIGAARAARRPAPVESIVADPVPAGVAG